MIGKSYDGTFANGVAATGVEGLTTIVPISAISDWYDYSRMGGIRFNTHYPASLSTRSRSCRRQQHDESHPPGVLPPEHNAHCAATRTAMSAIGASGDGDSDGDINAFWQDRNYNLDVDKVHASVFASHGLDDDNVKLNHFSQWWAGLAAQHVERKVWLHQLGHVDPFDYRRTAWVDTLHRWFDYWLYGVKNGIMKEPMADIEVAPNTWTTAKSWPVPHTKPVDVYVQGTVVGAKGALGPRSGGETTSLTFTDANLSENNYLSLTNTQANKLMFLSPPLTHDLRISGTPLIDIRASLSTTQTNLSAFLVDYGPGDVLRVNRASDGAQNLTTTSCWADPTQCAAPCPAAGVDNDPCYIDVTERTTTTSGGQTIPFKPTTWRVSKGILDSSNRDSLFSGFGLDALIGQTYEFEWPTLPNDFTFVAGHQVGIVIGTNFSGYGSVNGTTADRGHARHEAQQGDPADRRRRSRRPRLGRVRRTAGRQPGAARGGLDVHHRPGRDGEVQVLAERGAGGLLRRDRAERLADRHIHGRAADLHGDGDGRGRGHDDGDDPLHGRLDATRSTRDLRTA